MQKGNGTGNKITESERKMSGPLISTDELRGTSRRDGEMKRQEEEEKQ